MIIMKRSKRDRDTFNIFSRVYCLADNVKKKKIKFQ